MVKQGRGRLCPPLMVLHGKTRVRFLLWYFLFTVFTIKFNSEQSLLLVTREPAIRFSRQASRSLYANPRYVTLLLCILREEISSKEASYILWPYVVKVQPLRVQSISPFLYFSTIKKWDAMSAIFFPIFFSGVQRCWTSLLADINCNIVNLREGIVHIISKDCAAFDRIWFMKDPIKYLKLSTFLRLDLSFMKMTLSCRIT